MDRIEFKKLQLGWWMSCSRVLKLFIFSVSCICTFSSIDGLFGVIELLGINAEVDGNARSRMAAVITCFMGGSVRVVKGVENAVVCLVEKLLYIL